ncbi:hypothetical protein [Serratia ficaria]
MVKMPAESYGLFLSQYAIRVEKIRAVIALRSAPAHQPQGDHLHDIVLLPLIQRLPLGDAVPFGQAAEATAGRVGISSMSLLRTCWFFSGCQKRGGAANITLNHPVKRGNGGGEFFAEANAVNL